MAENKPKTDDEVKAEAEAQAQEQAAAAATARSANMAAQAGALVVPMTYNPVPVVTKTPTTKAENGTIT